MFLVDELGQDTWRSSSNPFGTRSDAPHQKPLDNFQWFYYLVQSQTNSSYPFSQLHVCGIYIKLYLHLHQFYS